MFIEGGSTTEVRILGVKYLQHLIVDLELEHSNILLIDLDHDTLYISDVDTYRWLWSTDRSVEDDNGGASHILQGCPLDKINMMCQVVWWSEWSDSNSDLAKIRESVSRTTAILNGDVVCDVGTVSQ